MGQGVVEGRLHRAGVTGGEVGRASGGLAREGGVAGLGSSTGTRRFRSRGRLGKM